MHNLLRGQLHTILEDMEHYPNTYLEELEAFLTLWDVKPRVEESSLERLSVDELITQLRQVKMAPERRPTVRWNPPVNRSTNRNNMDINSGIDTQMLNQLIATRVVEALAAAAVTHAASTQEETNLGSNSS
ncbi:hypothetical protein Tco_1459537 [Tanacetum coccineum]